MRVEFVNQYNAQKSPYYIPNFEAVKIRQINPVYSGMKGQLEKELELFVHNGDNADMLGAGVTSVVYKFKKFQDFVFKKSLVRKDSFDSEINNLKFLPDKMKNVQKFVAQAFDDETGLFYLISTKMNGKIASWDKNPWTRKHLRSLFSTMFQMDKSGIYHGDLHCGNILLDKNGSASLIDFQWAQKIIKKRFFENNSSSMMPPFLMNENAQMFEMASIPYYIKFMDNPNTGKEFLKTYLSEKALYHEKRSDYLRSIVKDWPYEYEQETILKGINYEDAQSILFRHPDEDVMRLETKKIQFLSSCRDTFGKVDIGNDNRDFVTAPSSQLAALSAIQELRQEIAAQKANKLTSSVKRAYLDMTEEYAKYWYDNIRGWVYTTFEASINTAEQTKFVPHSKNRVMESLTNIFDFIDEDYKAQYTREFLVSKQPNNVGNLKILEKRIKNFGEMCYLQAFDINIFKKINEMQAVNKKLNKALQKDWGFDVINLSILNLVKNSELRSIISKKSNYNSKSKDAILSELKNIGKLQKKMAEDNFKYILKLIDSDTPESKQLSGYKGMYNFE